MPDSTPTISAIIVSYNTRQMTLDCLAALFPDLADGEVFVVDNGSTDESVEAIREHFPSVRVIANTENVGFGAANNQAMALATGEFLLLLNSDAFVMPGAVHSLLEVLRTNPGAAIAGPRLLNRDGSLQISCFRFPSPQRAWLENLWIARLFSERSALGDFRRWSHDTTRPVDWIIGACMLVRRQVFLQVGGFDENFFMYAEESDWQKRIRDAHWEICFTPAAEVVHLGGASSTAQKVAINRHFFESLDYYERKHHGFLGLVSLRAAMAVGCFMRFWLWFGAALLPRRRAAAIVKCKLHSWLFCRQLTWWSSSPKFERIT